MKNVKKNSAIEVVVCFPEDGVRDLMKSTISNAHFPKQCNLFNSDDAYFDYTMSISKPTYVMFYNDAHLILGTRENRGGGLQIKRNISWRYAGKITVKPRHEMAGFVVIA